LNLRYRIKKGDDFEGIKENAIFEAGIQEEARKTHCASRNMGGLSRFFLMFRANFGNNTLFMK